MIRDDVLEDPRPTRPLRPIVKGLLNPLNLAVALLVAVAAALVGAVWLFAVAGAAYAALVVITSLSTPVLHADTRDATREQPWRDGAPVTRSFDG
jgi:hypothetical protein